MKKLKKQKLSLEKLQCEWLGNMGLWVKTGREMQISVWIFGWQQGRTGKNKLMKPKHQHRNVDVALQPNLRTTPCVIDPFAIKRTQCSYGYSLTQ